MKHISKECEEFYWAMGFIEGLIENDKFSALHGVALGISDSERLQDLLIGLDYLHAHMIKIKKSAGEQNRLTKGDQDG